MIHLQIKHHKKDVPRGLTFTQRLFYSIKYKNMIQSHFSQTQHYQNWDLKQYAPPPWGLTIYNAYPPFNTSKI